MPSFSRRSMNNLDTCNPLLVELFLRVVANFDCSVLEGVRSEYRQNTFLDEGRTKLKYPFSKHNVGHAAGRELSDAVDVIPYPVDWKFEKELIYQLHYGYKAGDDHTMPMKIVHNIERWFMFIGHVKGVASEMGIPIISGADWDGDNCMADQKVDDLPHFELG